MPNRFCRVCGFSHDIPPWGEDDHTPSFEICECCGVEFGYEDCTAQSASKYRSEWISNGAQWNDESERPAGWVLEEQLKQVPRDFSVAGNTDE